MAQGVTANPSLDRILELMKSEYEATSLWLRLFKNDETPDVETVVGDFEEADFPGYSAIEFTGWADPDKVVDGKWVITAPIQTFLCTGSGTPNDIYGYYITDEEATVLLYSERDPNAPFPMTDNGDEYALRPRIYAADPSVS